MKRIIVLILVAAMAMLPLSGMLGCSSASASSLTLGQWLRLIDEAFGMTESPTGTPYFKTISASDPYYAVFQIAADWGVIDTDREPDPNEILKWKQALVTLVNVGNFADSKSSEEEKIDCAIKTFDDSIRKYWMERPISPKKAVDLLSKAKNLWATREYVNNIERVDYKEGVHDLTATIKETDFEYLPDGVIVIPAAEAESLKAGDVYVLPATSTNPQVSAYKAEDIEIKDGKAYITNSDEDVTVEDVAENILIEETFVPQASQTVVYDGNGNLISTGSSVVNTNAAVDAPQFCTLMAQQGSASARQLGAKVKHSFEVEDWKISIEYNVDGSFDLKFKVEAPNMFSKSYASAHPSQALRPFFQASIDSLKITQNVDFQWFKLKSAALKVDYDCKLSGGIKYEGKPVNKLLAPEYRNTGGFLTNWAQKVWKDADGANAKGAKTIKICSVDIFNAGVARVCLDVKFIISADGTITVSISEHGTKGVEYKNGTLRNINISDKDVDVELKAKIEGVVGVGPALYVIGLSKPIIGLEVNVGLGAQAKVTFHVADPENHLLEETDGSDFTPELSDLITLSEAESDVEQIRQLAEAQGCKYENVSSGKVKLHFDTCVDISVYFILRIKVTDTSLIADLLGGKIKTTWEIFGDKNGQLLDFHFDNGDFQFGYPGHPVACTLKYVPFDKDTDATEDPDAEIKDNETIVKGDSIILVEMYKSLNVGDTYYIRLSEIPKGYLTSDLVCTSGDKNIATVTNNGIVSATGSGATMIEIKTKDGKFVTWLAIDVSEAAVSTVAPFTMPSF